MSVFKDAKLTLITDDGTELNVDVTPEKLAKRWGRVAETRRPGRFCSSLK